ncbi:hypothetical protein AGMMS49942_08250 [Spirochaetia bacterium]|nr:hypothetical protein AGMMS49942_08250 [Spirochaetia bacterium]
MNENFLVKHKRHVVLLFLFGIVFSTHGETTAIEEFDTKFSLGLSGSFNFVVFNNQNNNFISNAPAYLGLSFGYKDYSASFNIALPFTYDKTPGTRAPFDAGFVLYQEHWSEEIKVKFYDDWIFEKNPFDMQLITGYLQGLYIVNSNNFSLRAAYPMNRLQRTSSGSLIAGGNIRVTTIKSNSIVPYNERWWGVSLGPCIGYSYTFVMKNLFFLNFYILGGAALGVDCVEPGVFFSPFAIPKIAVGKHNKTWSMNFVLEFDYLSFVGENISHDFFLFNSASLGGVKRF